ncbi:DUF1275 domain-containing protein [bacterium]|nr:MAG: DUF1275 domain-containing protein [bacterium]
MTRYDRRSIALAVALSALAGYVDALGFLSLGNFFVSFMSGNSTRLAIAFGEERYRYALMGCGVVGLFVLGVVGGSLVGHRCGVRRRPAVLILVAGLLALAALLHNAGLPYLGTASMLLAMGAENAVFQRDGEVSIGLTYMTGTLVRMGQRLAEMAYGGSRKAWLPYFLLWLGLVMGALVGSVVHSRVAMNGLWLAAIAALILAKASVHTRLRYR